MTYPVAFEIKMTNVAMSIPQSGNWPGTPVTFDNMSPNLHVNCDNGWGSGYFTIPQDGVYFVYGQVFINPGYTGAIKTCIAKAPSGSTTFSKILEGMGETGSNVHLEVGGLYSFSAGERVRLYIWNTDAQACSIEYDATKFGLFYVGG